MANSNSTTSPTINTCLNVKIKEEKITPPPSPRPEIKKEKDDSSTLENILEATASNSLFDFIDTNTDEKKSVEPVKSSNEILAELFQVFSSAPTDSFLANLNHIKKSSNKKKHKKEKKHKKHKRKDADLSENENNGLGRDSSEKKIKLKKVKKEKDHKKKRSEDKNDDKLLNDSQIKKEKRKSTDEPGHKRHKKRKNEKDILNEITDYRKDHADIDINEYEKQLSEERVSKEAAKTNSTHGKTKIIIKNLKNSAVYEETVKQVEAQDHERAKRLDKKYDDGELSDSSKSKTSGISLSDEETYHRERNEYQERDRREKSYYNKSDRDDKYDSYRTHKDRRRYDDDSYYSRDRHRYGHDNRRRLVPNSL